MQIEWEHREAGDSNDIGYVAIQSQLSARSFIVQEL